MPHLTMSWQEQGAISPKPRQHLKLKLNERVDDQPLLHRIDVSISRLVLTFACSALVHRSEDVDHGAKLQMLQIPRTQSLRVLSSVNTSRI